MMGGGREFVQGALKFQEVGHVSTQVTSQRVSET